METPNMYDPIPGPTKLAYAAGALDGDGSIVIGGPPGHAVTVSLSGTHKEIPFFMLDTFDGAIGDVTDSRSRWTKYNYRFWNWYITGERTLWILRLLLPYLIAKKDQAEVALRTEGVKGRDRASYHRELRLLRTDVLKEEGEGITLDRSPEAYAYTAGLIETDGCITINTAGPDRHAYLERISLSGMYYALPRTLHLSYGGKISVQGKNRILVWNIYGKQATALLRYARPYMIAKAGQADTLLELRRDIDYWQKVARHAPRSKETYEYRRSLHERCKALKISTRTKYTPPSTVSEEEKKELEGIVIDLSTPSNPHQFRSLLEDYWSS